MLRRFAPVLLAVAAVLAATSASAQSPDVAYGKRIAERNCSGCHAVAGGRSPNPEAPPFRRLYKRYRLGGLDRLLSEGMIAPTNPPEEGSAHRHPKMPQAVLYDDEIDALKVYIRSLQPRRVHERSY